MNDSFAIEPMVAEIVLRAIAAGKSVEIDGLGVFHPDARRGVRFEAFAQPRVFIAHVQEDSAAAERIFDALVKAGFQPWMDSRKLLAGQNWPRAIETAIETSDFFLACYSVHSVNKRGGFQAEIRYALDCARRMPLDQIFLVPVRLDDCRLPRSLQRELHHVDLFPDWNRGLRRLVGMIRSQTRSRRSERPDEMILIGS